LLAGALFVLAVRDRRTSEQFEDLLGHELQSLMNASRSALIVSAFVVGMPR
jgi:hypothetical protein